MTEGKPVPQFLVYAYDTYYPTPLPQQVKGRFEDLDEAMTFMDEYESHYDTIGVYSLTLGTVVAEKRKGNTCV